MVAAVGQDAANAVLDIVEDKITEQSLSSDVVTLFESAYSAAIGGLDQLYNEVFIDDSTDNEEDVISAAAARAFANSGPLERAPRRCGLAEPCDRIGGAGNTTPRQ